MEAQAGRSKHSGGSKGLGHRSRRGTQSIFQFGGSSRSPEPDRTRQKALSTGTLPPPEFTASARGTAALSGAARAGNGALKARGDSWAQGAGRGAARLPGAGGGRGRPGPSAEDAAGLPVTAGGCAPAAPRGRKGRGERGEETSRHAAPASPEGALPAPSGSESAPPSGRTPKSSVFR